MADRVLHAVGEAITVQGPDGRLLWANQPAAEMLGFRCPAELLAAPVAELLVAFEGVDEANHPTTAAELPGRRALAGEEPPETLIGWRLKSTGDRRWSLVRARPVLADDGSVRFAVNVFRDVTARQEALAALRRSEERLRFLASASRALLAASMDPTAVLVRVGNLVVPSLADWCAVWQLDHDGTPRRVEDRPAREYRPAPVAGVEGGEPLLASDIDAATLDILVQDPHAHRLVAQLGPRSAVLVPVLASGRVVGALLLVSATPERYDASDVALAEELARRAGLAIDVARAYGEEHRAREAAEAATSRLRLLADLSRSLASSLDAEVVLRRLVECTVPTFANWCTAQLADEVDDGAPAGRAVRDRQTTVVADGATSTITVPIVGRSAPLGAITFAAERSPRRLTAADVPVAEEIGRRVGIAMENALMFAERDGAVSTLARALVPAELPEIAHLDLAARYRPAAAGVGGDFYDVAPLDDGRWLLLIGDVCGKGPEAAALTAMARYTVRALAERHHDPATLLQAANAVLAPQLPEGRFCTMAAAIVATVPAGAQLSVAVAGHPPPLVVSAEGRVRRCGTAGVVLGVVDPLELELATADLVPGDAVVLFTDGCIGEGSDAEAVLGGALGRAAGAPAAELADSVEKVAEQVDPGHPDDAAILVARLR